MIIKRSKNSVIKMAGRFLYPGNNSIAEKDDDGKDIEENLEFIENITKDPRWANLFKEQVELGFMEIVEKPKAEPRDANKTSSEDDDGDGFTDDIGEMTAKDAIKVVADTLILDDLNTMLAQEQSRSKVRGSVIKAINAQIEELKSDDDED